MSLYVVSIRSDSGSRDDFWPVRTWVGDLSDEEYIKLDTISFPEDEYFVTVEEIDNLGPDPVKEVMDALKELEG